MIGGNAADELDVAFYRAQYKDVGALSPRQVRRHYETHGRREERAPNARASLKTQEAKFGPLPTDFTADAYLDLNPDLKRVLPHPWQPAEHFLSCGRREGRRYRAEAAPRPQRPKVLRSAGEHVRLELERTFGVGAVDQRLVKTVVQALGVAEEAATVASPLISPVLVAGAVLSFPGAVFDFADLNSQLKLILTLAFVADARPAPRVEASAMYALRRRAIETEVHAGVGEWPAPTLFMLAAAAGASDRAVVVPTTATMAAFLGRFFFDHVPRLGLERVVTAEQRARLRGDGGRTAPALALREAWRKSQPDTAGSPHDTLEAMFQQPEAWRRGLAYLLSSEQLEAMQLRVIAADGRPKLAGPTFLLDQRPVSASAEDPVQQDQNRAWLDRFVRIERQAQEWPEVLVSPSAIAFVTGRPYPGPAPSSGSPGAGRLLLRPGERLGFNATGDGRRHLLGAGWSIIDEGSVWTAIQNPSLAIHLQPEDAGALDLVLHLSTAPEGPPAVTVLWNGRPCAYAPATASGVINLQCHLGRGHRHGALANLLCLMTETPTPLDRHGRRLGVALHSLMLVRR